MIHKKCSDSEGLRVRKTNKPNQTGGIIEAGTECCGSTEEFTVNLLRELRKDFKEKMILWIGSGRMSRSFSDGEA